MVVFLYLYLFYFLFIFSVEKYYVISNFKIDVAKLGLFIPSHMFVPPKHSVDLILFCIPFYSHYNYLNIVKYKHNTSMYSLCMNGYAS
jgi:hypothetical protein